VHLSKKQYISFVKDSRYDHMTDTELLWQFKQSSDNAWLGILLQRYTMLLLGVCMKYLKDEQAAKDAVQQVFLKAITELEKYEVAYFKSWLYMIARNHCLMQLRDRNIHLPVEEEKSLVYEETDKQLHTFKDTSLRTMEACLEELNDAQRTCVTLFYLQQKSYQQIADNTGFTLLQVKSHIQNGKRNLRLLIEQKMKQG